MNLLMRLTLFKVGALALMLLLPGCSKEGGYSVPEKSEASSSERPATPLSLTITSWGPQSTTAGEIFNAQPNGQAAFWMRVDQSLDGSDSVITLDGAPLQSAISGTQITASVPADLYAKPGKYTLHVVMKKGHASIQSNNVMFLVK